MKKIDYSIFTQIKYDENDSYVSQGWKLHCSGTIENYKEILQIVKKECDIRKIDYKYIKERTNVQFRLSGDCPVPAFGKLITIYPSTVEDFVLIAKELYSKLKPYHGPYVLSDNAVFNSEVLYYRYGAIDRDDGNLIDYETNNVIKDNRMYFEVPSFVNDPLSYEDDSRSKIINKTVFPEKIINTSSAGNTYLGKFQDKNVVIKEARNLVISSKGYAKQDLIREIRTIRALKKAGYVPKIIQVFDEFNNNYVVEEKLPGTTLDNWAAKDYREISKQLSKIFYMIIDVVNDLHNNGIVLQDISASNFMIDEVDDDIKQVYICDLGSSHAIDEIWSVDEGATVRFYDSLSKDLDPKEQDFHKIGYLFMSMIFPFNNFLVSDPTGNRTWELFLNYCDEENVSIEYVKIINQLVKTHSNCSKESIDADFCLGDELQYDISLSHMKPLVTELLSNSTNTRHAINLYKATDLALLDYVDNIENISLNGGLSGIGMLLITNKYLKASQHRHIIARIDYLIASNRNGIYLGIEKGILGALMYKLEYFISIGDDKQLHLVINELINFNHYIWHNDSHMSGMTTKTNNKTFSPYIMDGISGYVILLYWSLQYSNQKESNIIGTIIVDCIKLITHDSWSKHPGFGYGLTGLLYTVTLVQNNINTAENEKKYINQVYSIIKRMIYFSGEVRVYDRQYRFMDDSFTNGQKGILSVLNCLNSESGVNG